MISRVVTATAGPAEEAMNLNLHRFTHGTGKSSAIA